MYGWICFWEKCAGKVQGAKRVDVPVVPLHQVAEGAADDGSDAGEGGELGHLNGYRIEFILKLPFCPITIILTLLFIWSEAST